MNVYIIGSLFHNPIGENLTEDVKSMKASKDMEEVRILGR
jgi:hypothetical protein